MTAERLVHGLGTAPAPPDWPALTLPELVDVLAAFGAVPLGVEWHSPRPFSAASRVQTDRGDCFVKRHHVSVRTLADLAVEHAFAEHLRERGVPLPASWGAAVRRGEFVYEVMSPGVGLDRYQDALSWTPYLSVEDARAAGRALARLHVAAVGFTAPARTTQCLVTGSGILETGVADAWVAARPLVVAALPEGWRSALAGVLDPWRPRLAPLLPELAPAWGHGDWHGSNLLWDDDGVSGVLDLGLADRTTPVHDLATALERSVVDWLALAEGRPVTVVLDQALALVQGYAEVRPLTSAERAALPLVLPVVHVELALSELAYFHGVTRDRAAADLAWDGYLLGHAAWWLTEPAGRLLAAVTGP